MCPSEVLGIVDTVPLHLTQAVSGSAALLQHDCSLIPRKVYPSSMGLLMSARFFSSVGLYRCYVIRGMCFKSVVLVARMELQLCHCIKQADVSLFLLRASVTAKFRTFRDK